VISPSEFKADINIYLYVTKSSIAAFQQQKLKEIRGTPPLLVNLMPLW
jgi:hypothetical protein